MKRFFLFVILFFCAASARASITDTGVGCAVATTTCTITGIQAGDMAVAFAFKSSVTAPTLPSGWTSIATASASSSSFRQACAVATGTSITVGTWTGATDLVIEVYRGTAATTTANCVTAGTGGHANSSGSATATISYGAITMTNSDGSSWVIGQSGSTAHTCTPTGMSAKQTVTGPVALANDTNGGVSSWGTVTCTGTSGNSKTAVVELIAPCSLAWCLVQHPINASCASGTTCTITFSPTTIAGQLAVITATGLPNSTHISSVSAGLGTFVHCSNCNASDTSGDFIDQGYVLSTASGQSSAVITLSSSASGAWLAAIYIYSYTYPSIQLDTSASSSDASCTTCAGQALTLSGSNDVIVQSISSLGTASAITAPYSNPADMSVYTAGAINTNSGTAPNWTQTSSTVAKSAMAFMQTPTAGAATMMPAVF